MTEPILLGSPLRDAAVDPHPTDLPSILNAGRAHPHSQLVRTAVVDSPAWRQMIDEKRSAELEARPHAAADVQEWRDYATRRGARPQDVRYWTKRQLIETFGVGL